MAVNKKRRKQEEERGGITTTVSSGRKTERPESQRTARDVTSKSGSSITTTTSSGQKVSKPRNQYAPQSSVARNAVSKSREVRENYTTRRQRAEDEYNARLNRIASMFPVGSDNEEYRFWDRKVKQMQYREGANDDGIYYGPQVRTDAYKTALQNRDAAKARLDIDPAQVEKNRQKNTFIESAQKMSYENLRDTINSGYLSNEQVGWANEILRDKANATQANEERDRLLNLADQRQAELDDEYKGMEAYLGQHEQDMAQRRRQEINNLRQQAQLWGERGYMAEGADIASDAMRAYAEAGVAVPRPRADGIDNDQYNFIMGNSAIADPDMDIGYIEKKYVLTPAEQQEMTANEKITYSDLFQQDQANGTDNATRYLKWLQYSLSDRVQAQTRVDLNKEMDTARAMRERPMTGVDWLDKGIRLPGAAIQEAQWFLRARGANVASGIGAIDATIQRLVNSANGEQYRPVNWNTAAFTPHTASETITQNQLSQIESPVGQFLYQTGGSMADSLVVMGASLLGVPAATAILGGSAATDSMLKAKERGATDSQALTVGILSGVAESLFEEVSLEKLLSAGTPATLTEAVKNAIMRQGVTEASEEVATTIANTITDALIMGDKSELRTKIRQYMEQGYSQSDAEKMGAIEWFKDLGMDALGGYLSGGVFGAGSQAVSYNGFRGDIRSIENAPDVDTAIDMYQQAMQRVVDENGDVRKDSRAAADRLRETYERTLENLTDYKADYAETSALVDRMVEDGYVTEATGELIKANARMQMEGDVINDRAKASALVPTGENAVDFKARAESDVQAARARVEAEREASSAELEAKQKDLVSKIADASSAVLSSTQSVVDNYDASLGATPTAYFDAFRYYEEMGQQARATGVDNFAEVWKNDERYSNSITQHAAIVAFSAGKTTAAPASKIMQVTKRGTGALTYSDEAMRQLANNVKSVNDAVELLSAFAKKTGFNVSLDESLADGENAAFIASTMTIAINPRANIIEGLFHESGHAIQRFNASDYAQLKADMISWYAQTQGMRSMEQMLAQYAKAYKGYSRDALEIEMTNDAFGALFNRTDAAEDIANWLAANKTEAEQKSFVKKLTELIDRIVNWVKGLVNLDDVSPMQKRTIEMQVEKAQAFRQAFLDALDKASENAQTATEFFSEDGSGHDYSMKSFADGLGFDLDDDLNLIYKDGGRVSHVTGDMIRESKLGSMISYAQEHGRITSDDMDTELQMLADILNMAIEKGDNNLMMYWEVAGSMVFSALKDNSDKQYGLTVDMSTICAKTKAIVDAMSETMLRLGRGLTREEVEVVYYTTGKNGEPTPCPVCYVFSRWFGIGGLLDDINTFQKEYGKQSTKKDMEFAKRILGEIIEFKDNSSKTKQKDYWSARDNAWKYGRIASDMKSKYNSWISSAEKAIANSDTIRATIAELQAQQAVVDEKTAKKLQTQINNEMKKKALLTDEQRQQKFDDIENYKKGIHDVEAWQWLIKTKLSMDKDGNFTKTEGWKPVPPEILFDLNRGAEFASQYPLTWAYRTGKGSAMGKAMMPYSDVRVGEIAQGVAKGSVKEIKMGIDPDDEIKFNPFNADDAASVKKQLETLESAVKKTRRQNLIGGMRFQSTSDFRYEYGSDYLMAFLELQALGSNVQLYTKVIEAVDFLASMNADINLSAMPLGDGWYEDETGRHLQSSSVTGINFEAAVEMSRKYDNVQIIMVGINRNHILTCLEGDEVTFVIPFHGSGQNVAQIAYLMDMLRENLDVMRAQDYTNYQSDHDMLKDSRKLTDEEKKRGVNTWGLTIEEQARAKAMRDLRMDILTGKLSSGLSDEQRALLKQSKFLGDLYNRFYVDENSREFGVTLEKDVAKQVFPYEYWDKTGNYDNADINGQRFVEYCAEIGYAPRFSGYNSKGQYNPEFDFYSNGQQKGYWKLLIDRPMYSNRYDAQGNWVGYGDYREQKAINAAQFKMETIDPTWQTATYGNVMGAKNTPSKIQKIADESIGYLKKGLRYDTETKTLVPKGQETRPTKVTAEEDEEDVVDYSRRIEEAESLAPVFQEITSARTSRKQVAALFKDKNVVLGDVNIDIGGGKYDVATEYLRERGTENMVFDPYNRDEAHNRRVLQYLMDGNRGDTATCTNVLNVIAEEGARSNVILEVAKAIKEDGTAYFSVYEGDGSGVAGETSNGYQLNRVTADYVDEIKRWFQNVERKGKVIIAKNPVANLPKALWEITPGNAVEYSRGDRTSLTDTERRTLEKRVREAERNAAKEKQRAEHFKQEMKLTPKFTPDAGQITELAEEIATSFGNSEMDHSTLEKNLRDIFWNINEAQSSGKESRADKALALAKDVATAIVDETLGEFMGVSVDSRIMRDDVIAMETNAIMDRILQTRMAKSTKADKWNAKLQEARAKAEKTGKTLKKTETYAMREAKRADTLESELAAYKQKMADKIAFIRAKADADHAFNRQAYEERIARVRANRDLRLREQKEYYMGRVSDLQESKRVAKLMPKVKKEVDALRKMLLSPDEKTYKYIPDVVHDAVTDYLSCVDFVTRTMATTGEPTKSDAREITKLNAIRDLAQKAKNMQNSTEGAEYLLDLPDDTVEVIDLLINRVTSLVNALQQAQDDGIMPNEIHLRVADSTTLDIIRRLSRAINQAVTNINRNYVQGRFAHVDDGAMSTMQFLEGVKRSAKYNRTLGNSLLWAMATPYYAFQRFGEGGAAIFENLGNGLAQMAKNDRVILDFVAETFSHDEQREWSKQLVTMTVTNAKGEEQTLTMTATQLMSLYCLSRREAAQNHLYTGGITLQEIKVGNTTISQEQAVHITQDSLFAALDKLSDRQKEVAQKLQEFMSTTCSDWGNYVTMRRWGVNSFEEKFYFPMKTSDNGRATMKANDDDASSLYGMVNQGFTKHLQTNANNALVIDDIFSVFTDHSANMAKYNAMVLPLLDAMKWYNWTQRADTSTAEGDLHRNDISVKGAIKEAFGTGATQYFRQFIADLNSAKAEGGAGFTLGQTLMSNYKAAAVAANLRVALLQPTAIFRAGMLLSATDLARGAAMRGGLKEMMQYSGLAQWKDFGFYDTDIGRSIRRQIMGERTKAMEVRNTIVDKSLWLAEKGDQITWAAIWNACKIEQQRLNKGASYEQLMELTEKRFNEVVFATQVFDSTLSRSEVMRKRDPYHKIITAFLSEPMLSYNMVLDKFMQYSIDTQKLGRGKAWSKHGGTITKALAVYSVTNLVAALAESIVDAFRDDDDEPWLEKFMEKLFGDWSEVNDVGSALKALYSGNLASDMTVIGKIPLAKEVISLLQGYDIGGRMDTQSLQSIATMIKIWDEKYSLYTGKLDKETEATWWGNMTTYGAIYKSMQALSQVTGLPIANFMRDAGWIYNDTIAKLTGFRLDTYESARERKVKEMQSSYGMTDDEAEYAKNSGLSNDQLESYYTKVYKNLGKTPKAAGIPLQTWEEFIANKKEQGASKKEDILPIIDALDVSNEIKDAIYLTNYAQSTIDDAPWH